MRKASIACLALASRLNFARRTRSLAALALSGCTGMSGLGGSSSYGCKAPEGVTCDSVSGTYANAVQNNLPSQRRKAYVAGGDSGAAPGTPGRPLAGPSAIASATPPLTPLRSSARILRLWFKPWEDADHDLYDQGYVYVQIDSGQWLVEHAQRQIRDAYAPLRPPPRSAAAPGEGRDQTATALPKDQPSVQPAQTPLKGLAPQATRPIDSD